jgi:hypothetical protein
VFTIGGFGVHDAAVSVFMMGEIRTPDMQRSRTQPDKQRIKGSEN